MIRILVWIALSALALVTTARAENRLVEGDYHTQAAKSGGVSSLGPDLFGDAIDLNTGSVNIVVTDISLPGNNDLPVAIQRRFQGYDDGISMLSWTEYELPYLNGLYRSGAGIGLSGWQGDNPQHPEWRCSEGQAPEVNHSSGRPERFFPEDYWHGVYLNLPGGGSQLMQGGSPSDVRNPQDGAIYFWATQSRWYFSCLPATANGVAGEGFLARSPDGKKYRFDWLVRWGAVDGISKPVINGSTSVLLRDEWRMYPTLVDHREPSNRLLP